MNDWWEWPLTSDWYSFDPGSTDLESPLLYSWEIEGVGSYVGKTTGFPARRRLYELNVARALNGRPYRRGNPNAFRTVHWELAAARVELLPVRLSVENVDPERVLEKEQELIRTKGSLNGGRAFLSRPQVRTIRDTFVTANRSYEPFHRFEEERIKVIEHHHVHLEDFRFYGAHPVLGFGRPQRSFEGAVQWLMKTRGYGIVEIGTAEVLPFTRDPAGLE